MHSFLISLLTYFVSRLSICEYFNINCEKMASYSASIYNHSLMLP